MQRVLKVFIFKIKLKSDFLFYYLTFDTKVKYLFRRGRRKNKYLN